MKLASVGRVLRVLFDENRRVDQEYRRWVKKKPNDAELLGAYAHFLASKKQDYVRATEFFEKAIALDPVHATNLTLFGNALVQEGVHLLRAEELLERAFDAASDDPIVLGSYAIILFKNRRDPVRTREVFDWALEQEESYVPVWANFAMFLHTYGLDPELAEETFEEALLNDADDDRCRIAYASFQADAFGAREGAWDTLEPLLRLDPNDAEIARACARCLDLSFNDQVEALRLYELALSLEEATPAHLMDFAAFLARTGWDVPRAIKYLEQAATAAPGDPEVIGLYAKTVADRTGDLELADRIHKSAVDRAPGDARMLASYGYFLRTRKRDAGAALAVLEEALTISPGDSFIQGELGSLLGSMGVERERARSLFESALSQLRYPEVDAYSGQFALLDGDSEVGLARVRRCHLRPTSLELRLQCRYYLFAHGDTQEQEDSLADIKWRVITQSVRSPGWNLKANGEKAIADGHPAAEWLLKLAAVITDGADPATLDDWPEWAAIEV